MITPSKKKNETSIIFLYGLVADKMNFVGRKTSQISFWYVYFLFPNKWITIYNINI